MSTGELHVPLEVCGAVVKRELDFWQIDEMEIKACCWRHYRSYIENQAILEDFNNSLFKENYNIEIDHLKGWKKFQMRVWLILDHPRTSKVAMAYGIISFLFVVTSIAGFCLETLPDLRPDVAYNVSATCHGKAQIIAVVMTSNAALNVLDIICTVFFSLELVMRFTFSPSKRKFLFSPMNIIDLLALVPLYVTVIFQAWNLQACYLNEQFVIEIMFILRIFRMFRIFHLVKHYQALKVLVYALRASLQELLMLFIFLLIAMLVFATMIYYAEREDATTPGEMFSTIPMGFWWAIITMTTVGYGDVSPVTPIGYIVGTCCCVVGVLLVALTFPVISNNFTLFYTHVRSRPVKQVAPVRSHSTSSTLNELGSEGGGGGGLKPGGRSSGSMRRNEEEEHLLRSPFSSPTHSGPRKASSGSPLMSEPYMNGGALTRVPSRASSGTGRALPGANRLYAPALAKFSDSNSMTDIILSRGGRGSPSTDNDSGLLQHIMHQQAEQPRGGSVTSRKTQSDGSVTSRKTQSDDGMRYQGETRL
ncbi:potassium voltage-gated channel protein Shaw-like [Littorina saxatilis]|uniref:potassium voltage-gated channel protein Shaw-like n=1 Tax=Littorina saxatilis TaxID=31220 RepID=UPI0038B5C07C